MSEQSTEVKGFKNSALGKVLFKIAAIAGLQEELNGKADASHTHSSISLYNGATQLGEVSIENERIGGAVLNITLQPSSAPVVGGTAHAQTLSIGALHLPKLANALAPDSAPVENSQKLITSGAVYAAIAEAIDEPAELSLFCDFGEYPLWSEGIPDTGNINSVKSFFVSNPANIVKRCLITHAEPGGTAVAPDIVTYYTGYAKWTVNEHAVGNYSHQYKMELWIPGLHKFLSCSVASMSATPSSDADDYDWPDSFSVTTLS